jgi:hypothetical protein
MNIQSCKCKPTAKVKVIGRPMWQVSLKASVQRGRKRLKEMLCASVAKLCASILEHCASCEPQVLGRAA